MILTHLTTRKFWLCCAVLLSSNLIFGQSFYKTYSQLGGTSAYEVHATSSGFDVETNTILNNQPFAGILKTNSNGNFQSHNVLSLIHI